MPRENQAASWGNGPQCRRRGSCQRMGYGFGRGFCRTPHEIEGSTSHIPIAIETIEAQAERLEVQAANLRNLAKQIHET